MTDRKVRAAYDKIRIDPNSAVRIWKNILSGEQSGPIVKPVPLSSGKEREAAVPQQAEKKEKIPVISVTAEAADEAAETVMEKDYADTAETDHEPAATAEGELTPETTSPFEEEYTPRREEKPARRSGHSRSGAAQRPARRSREKGKPTGSKRKFIIPALLIAAAFVAGALLFFRGRSNDVSEDMPPLQQSELSVPVVTKPPVAYEGSKEDVNKISAIQEAMAEWNSYKQQSEQQYIAENLPSFTEFLRSDDFFDGVGVEENGDETYSLVHWVYEEDWGNTSISPITGQEEPSLIQKFDSENSVTVEKDEYASYLAYVAAKEAEGTYGDYNYSYGVSGESDAKKLEEIAAAHKLTLRKGEGTNRGFGEAGNEELVKSLSTAAGKGDIYTSTPELDYYTCFDNGAFNAMAEIKLPDGRRMYTLLCSTPYTEMIDAVAANGIIVHNGSEMSTRKYTAADGTELVISYNDDQAIVYAYLDNCYVVMDMGINAWHSAPDVNDTPETLLSKQEKDFSLNEEVINFTADSINYKNIGK